MVVGDVVRGALFVSIPIVGTLEWLYIATVLIECAALFWMPAKEATVPNLVPRQPARGRQPDEPRDDVRHRAGRGASRSPGSRCSTASWTTSSSGSRPTRSTSRSTSTRVTFFVSAAGHLPGCRSRGARRAQRQARQARLGLALDRRRLDVRRHDAAGPRPRARHARRVRGGRASSSASRRPTSRDLGAGQPGFGVLFGAVFVGLAAGMWVGPRLLRGFSRRRLFGLALILAGGFLAALALMPNIVMATLFATGLGACGGVAWVTGYTLLGLEVDDVVRGRTFGFLTSMARIVLVLVLADRAGAGRRHRAAHVPVHRLLPAHLQRRRVRLPARRDRRDDDGRHRLPADGRPCRDAAAQRPARRLARPPRPAGADGAPRLPRPVHRVRGRRRHRQVDAGPAARRLAARRPGPRGRAHPRAGRDSGRRPAARGAARPRPRHGRPRRGADVRRGPRAPRRRR